MTPELETFFHDLRVLRAGAGLSLTELAERAHFPEETLKAAETGPSVPSNPVLVAYVRACGGPAGEWEDRWRAASAAPAEAAAAAAPADGHRGRRVAVAAAAAAIVAGGSALALTRPTGHPAPSAGRHPSPGVSRSGISRPGISRPRAGLRPPAASAPPATSAPRVASVLRVAGAGCPVSRNDGIVLTAARPGRPWTPGGGGWAGNGCDGTSVWTMAPAGEQPDPPALTWFFGAASGVSHCTLSVYVPTQNALGQAGYAVSGDSGATLATVSIDQADDAGDWVVLGTFPAAGSGYRIQLMPEVTALTAAGPGPAGKGPGKPAAAPGHPGHDSAVAASAAAMDCSGSPR